MGKGTLDLTLDALGIKGLTDDKIIQREHQLDPSDETRKALCAVRVSFLFNRSETSDPIRFYVQLDVIGGNLPFLIGLPSLTAIGATLNFRQSNLSMVIHQNVYRPYLIEHAFHLRIRLSSKGSYI